MPQARLTLRLLGLHLPDLSIQFKWKNPLM